jgi:hypothetical protein
MSDKRRTKSYQRFVLLPHWMLKCPAWKTLRPRAAKLLIAVWARHNGSNNGEISFSVREAMEIGISSSPAAEDFAELVERGFLVVSRQAAFTLKTKEARTWRLTAEPSGLNQEHPATKDFMRWTPAISADPQSARADRGRPRKFRTQSSRQDTQSCRQDREPENETKLPITVLPAGPSGGDYGKSRSARQDTSISTKGDRPTNGTLPKPANALVVRPLPARPKPQRARGSAGDGQATTEPTTSLASVTSPDQNHQPSTDAVAVADRVVEMRSGNTIDMPISTAPRFAVIAAILEMDDGGFVSIWLPATREQAFQQALREAMEMLIAVMFACLDRKAAIEGDGEAIH